MATIDITKTYADGEILLEADLDQIVTDIETFLNTTQINDDNIQTAGITASSKLVDASISTAKIADDAVTSAKIAATAVVTSVEHNGFVGEVRMFHTFNSAVAIPRGWMVLDGDVVNQTNYDAQHGSGAYTTDGVASSALLNKNLPDMTSKYPVGVASTTQSGASAITGVGNSSHQISLQHSHTVDSHTHSTPAHVHQVYNYNGSSSSGTIYNSGGSGTSPTSVSVSGGVHLGAVSGSGLGLSSSMYTNSSGSGTSGAASPGTNNALSTTQSIQPESIELIYIMKVV